jgi:XTP/dITP diphosphohydrolase
MEGVSVREAYYKSAVAFCKAAETSVMVFTGVVKGTISWDKRGEGGFGYDPIFIPSHGDGRTFAEMNPSEKGLLSHRGRALREFGEWFTRTDES